MSPDARMKLPPVVMILFVLPFEVSRAAAELAQEKSSAVDPSAQTPTDPADQVTAEELLRVLRRERPSSDPIPSASQLRKRLTPSPAPILPEGSTMIETAGSLVRADDWWTMEPRDCKEPCHPIKVLPNAQLELMTRMLSGSDSAISFVVSGELTAFGQENYLLIKHAARDALQNRQASAAPMAPTPKPKPKADDSVEDVLAALRDLSPDQAAIPKPPAPALPNEAAARGLSSRPAFLPDGSALANRPGRLVREGSWWTLVMESSQPEGGETPIRLLPCQVLEAMVAENHQGSIGLVFMVSGDVTQYEGENYLLIRSMMRRIDLGNLRK